MGNLSWSQGDSQSKKKELGAYRMLGLGREMKSIRRRSAADQAGLYRYIGEGNVERPVPYKHLNLATNREVKCKV